MKESEDGSGREWRRWRTGGEYRKEEYMEVGGRWMSKREGEG